MSWLSSLGHGVGKVLDNKLVKGGLAAGGQLLGIPAPATYAALGAAGGALKPGGGLKGAVHDAGHGVLQGTAVGALTGGAQALAGGSMPSWLGKLGGIAKNAGGSLLGAGKDFALNDSGGVDWGNLAKLGLGATALYGQHQSTNAANDYQNKMFDLKKGQLDDAKADYATRAPMRAQAMSIAAKLGGQRASDVYRPKLAKEMGI